MLTVTRTNGTVSDVNVPISYSKSSADIGPCTKAIHGVDTPDKLRFGDDESLQTFCVAIKQDEVFENPDEKFQVELKSPDREGASLGSKSTASIVILDDGDAGTLSFSSKTMEVTESEGAVTVTVTRTGLTSSAVCRFPCVPFSGSLSFSTYCCAQHLPQHHTEHEGALSSCSHHSCLVCSFIYYGGR
jgi:hypothetical protein